MHCAERKGKWKDDSEFIEKELLNEHIVPDKLDSLYYRDSDFVQANLNIKEMWRGIFSADQGKSIFIYESIAPKLKLFSYVLPITNRLTKHLFELFF